VSDVMNPAQRGEQPPGFDWWAWLRIWRDALLGPFGGRFKPLAAERSIDGSWPYTWIGGAALLSAVILLGVSWSGSGPALIGNRLGNPAVIVCGLPLSTGVMLALFSLYTGLTHGLARLVGGHGHHDRLVFLHAAYGAPLLPVMALLMLGPLLAVLLVPLLAYVLLLNVGAARAVYGLDWGRAVVVGAWLAGAAVLVVLLVLAAGSFTIRL
jgi:hypothetical protein